MWAVRSGSSRIVELLLEQKIQVDIYRDDWTASTPLQAAIRYHRDDLVRLLLDAGADPDPDDCRDWPGYPPDDLRPLGRYAEQYESEHKKEPPLITRFGAYGSSGSRLWSGSTERSTLTFWPRTPVASPRIIVCAAHAETHASGTTMQKKSFFMSPSATIWLMWSCSACRPSTWCHFRFLHWKRNGLAFTRCDVKFRYGA